MGRANKTFVDCRGQEFGKKVRELEMIWQSCSLPIPHKNFWDEREVVLPLSLRIWDRPQWEASSPASPLPQRRMVDCVTGLERALSFLPVSEWHSRVCEIPCPRFQERHRSWQAERTTALTVPPYSQQNSGIVLRFPFTCVCLVYSSLLEWVWYLWIC